MGQIFIFSEKYYDVLATALPEAGRGRIGHMYFLTTAMDAELAAVLVEIIAEIKGAKHAQNHIQAELLSFLAENSYIHFDAFIGICLEGLDETQLCARNGKPGGLD